MIPQHNVMEKENEGRCPVGGVPHHGGEHVMVLLIPVRCERIWWRLIFYFLKGWKGWSGGDGKCTPSN